MKQEWRELFSNRWLKIVMVAIVIIPCVYAGVFLGSMWDPYGNTNNIPVAVVNEDKAVTYNEKTLDIGEGLVKNLEDNDSMSFQTLDADKAQSGLENGDYYMIITIPQNFSQHATTLLDDNPEKMVLEYTTNPGTNYIASKMDDSAIEKIKTEVSSTVTKTYAETIFNQIGTLSQGLNDATKGTTQLNDGVEQIVEGNNTISQNLKTLALSSLTFKEGTETFQQGLKDYTKGVITVHNGIYSLKSGLDQLNQSTTSLSQGIQQLNQGTQTLTTGVSQYTTAVKQTYQGTKQLVSQEKELTEGVKDLSSATEALKTLNEQMTATLTKNQQDMMTGNTNDATLDMQTIVTLQKNIAVITTNLNSSMNGGLYYVMKDGKLVTDNNQNPITTTISEDKTLLSGISQYTKGVQQVNQGLSQLDEKSTVLLQGSKTLSQGINVLASQTPSLIQGIVSLDQGANTLYQGTTQLTQNNEQLLSGSNTLCDGASQIASGSNQLANGSLDLGRGLHEIKKGTLTLNESLADGAKKSQLSTTEQTLDMLASPITTQNKTISTVENNGHAMAPYMMSVALYVACLAFALMYPLQKDICKAKSGFRYWLSKSTIWFFISTLAALAMVATLMLVNGFHPQQTLMTFIFAVVVAAAFMSLVIFLSISIGRIGEFILLIFMVINLGGSAGTYPLETSGGLYQMIHPYVPFTYSVNGFRKVISQTTISIHQELLVFVGIFIICSAFTILFYNYRIKKPTPLIPQAFEENH